VGTAGTEVLLTLLGGVGLLLWGVRMVRTGLTRTFGAALRSVLNRASQNRISAFGTGVGVAGVLQSATATALLLASFAGRGLLTLPIALTVMLGADVGTTLVAQVFAFDVKWLWALFMIAGVVAFNSSNLDNVKSIGRIAIGLALMLLALLVLGNVSGALRSSPTMQMVLSALGAEPVLAVLVAALITWLAHSSLAIVLMVMALAAGGSITPTLSLALVLGANIGGAIAPFVALSGAPVAARRVPLGNFLARGVVGLIAIPLIGTVVAPLMSLSVDPARLVLNFHTAFNLVVALVFLPLVEVLAKVSSALLPEPTADVPAQSAPRHLDASILDTPSEALGCAMRETLHVGDIVLDMLRRSLIAIEGNDRRIVKDIEKTDDDVDGLHEAIKLFLIQASKTEMTETESRRYVEILTFTTNLEHIGDIIDKNLMELATKKIKKRLQFSSEGIAELKQFHGLVIDNMRLALNVFATRDINLARRLLKEKTLIRAHEQDAADRHFSRLRDGRPESIETSAIHLDVIRDLKRINSHLTSVSYSILDEAGELIESRLRERAQAEEDSLAATLKKQLPSS
jgi:phosphate:Na+ symporter